eukprot:m.85883 g.85883  ORF g.85883 m.85883 type:complete len:940 (+) comp25907_c1_seq1:205-3024(+)
MATTTFTPTTTVRKAISNITKKKSGPKSKGGDGSKKRFEDPVLNRIFYRLIVDQNRPHSGDVTDENNPTATKTSSLFNGNFPVIDDDGNRIDSRVREKRYEVAVNHLKKGSLLTAKQRQTPRSNVFQEQLKIVEEKQKNDIGVMDDIQEFMRARSKLEIEHAQNLQKLSQQFHSKRKWPAFTYVKGHEDILLIDMWRSVVNLAMEDAKAHSMASERLNFLANDLFDQHKDQKKIAFRTAMTVLEQLQDELFKLDASVTETKHEYDAAMKSVDKAKNKKKSTEADVKKLESSCQFRRQEYLLELAAANDHYMFFRDQQLPELMDAATGQHTEFFSEFFKAYATLFSAAGSACFKNMQKVDKLSGRLDATLERRTFLHQNRNEFPGRQLFEMEPHASETLSHELKVDDHNKHVLVKMRELLKHSCGAIAKGQKDKQKQMTALQKLYRNYMDASDMFDKQQPKLIEEKMVVLHQEIEAASLQRRHLEAKIARITSAGIDDVSKFPSTPTQKENVMDLKQAQERETVRRMESLPAKVTQPLVEEQTTSSTPRRGSAETPQTTTAAPMPTPRRIVGVPAEREEESKENPTVTTNSSTTPATKKRPSLTDYGNVVGNQREIEKEDPYMCPATLRNPEFLKGSPPSRVVSARPRRVTNHDADARPVEVVPRRRRPTLLEPPKDSFPPPDLLDIAAGDSSDDEGFECLPPPPLDFDVSILDSIPPPPTLNDTELESFRDLPPPPSPDFGFSQTSVVANLNRSSRIYEELIEAELPLLFKSLYHYEAINQDDIDLVQGEHVYVLVARDDGWCQGVNLRGNVGFFPASYVEREDDKVITKIMVKPRLLWIFAGSSGYGMQISGKCPVRVTQVMRGGAADKAGVKKGDVILEIDGESFAEKDAAAVTDRLARTATSNDKRAKVCVLHAEPAETTKVRQGLERANSGMTVV